uniref:Odorant receptor 136 n=1 Tax=Culex quinquefasciatus TaxID=7176 RepID=A0A0A0QKD4_CULQU|nr:odorant receptor 136 [Culex quinquefasciatus]
MTQFTSRAVQTVKKWLKVKCSEMKQNCKNLYSKAFVLDPDGDHFSVVKKMEQFCGFHAKIETTKGAICWALLRLIILARFSHMIGKFILTFIEEDDFEYKFLVHTVTYMMFYNYTQVILLRFSYQDLSSIRKFFNARKYLKTDPEAHRIRSAAYRKTNWAILGPLPMWTFLWISMVLTGVYKWRVLNIEPKTLASYPILQAIIMYGYPVQNLIIAGWYQLPAVLINSVLLGFITELKILTDSCDKIIDNAEIAVEKERLESESTDADALFWKHFKIELDARVKAHITVLANLINLRQILKPCLLLYYYTLLMVNAFIICSVKNGYFKDFASSTIIMAVYFNVDFFIICYNMSQVDDLCSKVGKRIYNLPWPYKLTKTERFVCEYRSIRSTMMVMMMRAQAGMAFSCGGFFEMSMGKFAELMDLTYTMVMFVLHLQE